MFQGRLKKNSVKIGFGITMRRCLVFAFAVVVFALPVTVSGFEEAVGGAYLSVFPEESDDGVIDLFEDIVLDSQFSVSAVVVFALPVTVSGFEEAVGGAYLSVFPEESDDGVIDLFEDIVLDSQFSVSRDVTIDGHGFVLSPSDDTFADGALISHSNGVLILKDLIIDCHGRFPAIVSIARFADIILENVTIINAPISTEQAALSFGGRAGKTVELSGVTLENGARLEISGGVTANIAGHSVIGNIYADSEACVNIRDGEFGSLSGEGTFQIFGGRFDREIDQSLCAPDHQIVQNNDGSYSVVKQNEFDASINVALGGNISVKVNVSAVESTFDEALKVTFSGESGVISEYTDHIGAASHLTFSLPIAAAQMNDQITIAIETETVKKVRTISVTDYAMKLMADSALSPEAQGLLSAMLDYGTACQYIHGYNTDDPANSSWNESYFGSYSEIRTGYTVKNSIEGISLSISLLTQDSTTLRISINGENLSDCICQLDGIDVRPVFKSSSSAYIDVTGIQPQALDIMHTITLERDGKSAQVVCSALSYAEIVLKAPNASVDYKNFAEAL